VIRSHAYGRPSRSGPSRSSEPDGRPPANRELRHADLVWELWNLRALFPAAEKGDLIQILRRREQGLAREREALVGLRAGDQGILSPGRRLLANRPELQSGLVVSLHQGPYQLLAEPWLDAGLEPVLLIDAAAEDDFAAATAGLSTCLRHKGRLTFLGVGPQGFVKQAVRAVREGRPVLVYLDGNSGERGMARTRDQGLRYQLPGREIRVRTGLARLACRLETPVHALALRWDQGTVVWEREPTLQPRHDDDPLALTQRLFDWLFSQVLRQPDQWHYWPMLKESSACFATAGFHEPRVPQGLRDDFRRAYDACLERSPQTVRLLLEKDVEVWPGDVLADLTEDRFYPAAGMADDDLESLRGGTPTLAELTAEHGQAWVRFHGLRLCLLGMARLGG